MGREVLRTLPGSGDSDVELTDIMGRKSRAFVERHGEAGGTGGAAGMRCYERACSRWREEIGSLRCADWSTGTVSLPGWTYAYGIVVILARLGT